jgi:hypothetical protein
MHQIPKKFEDSCYLSPFGGVKLLRLKLLWHPGSDKWKEFESTIP